MTTSCYWILLLLLCRHVAEAKTVAGTIQSSSELQYIAKFCWSAAGSGPEAGIFSGRLTAQVPLQDTLGQTAMPLFLLYDGGEDSWPATYGRATSCHSKVNASRAFEPISTVPQWIEFSWEVAPPEPQFWYLGVINCGIGTLISYELHFENAGVGEWRELSYEECGMSSLSTITASLMVLLLITHLFSLRSHKQTNTWYLVHLVHAGVLACYCLAGLCVATHYKLYIDTGEGSSILQVVAGVVQSCGESLLLTESILLGQGHLLVSPNPIPSRSTATLICLSFIGYWLLLVWGRIGATEGVSVQMFSTTPGGVVLLMRMLLCGWFCQQYLRLWHIAAGHQIQQVYKLTGLVLLTWYLVVPMVSMVVNCLPPWQQLLVMETASLVTTAATLLVFTYLMAPRTGHLQVTLAAGSTPYDVL